MIGVAVLHRYANRLFEGDGAFVVPAIEAVAAADAFGIDHVGRALMWIAEGGSAEVPGAVVVVLRAGAVDGGRRVAVDEDHVIAFAEPLILILQNGVRDADEVAFAGGFEEDVV